jgi:hypothetical protein
MKALSKVDLNPSDARLFTLETRLREEERQRIEDIAQLYKVARASPLKQPVYEGSWQ